MMGRLKNIIALGVIDEDKNKGPQAQYFYEFDLVKEENNLILKKHKEREHFIILICPEIERFLLEDAQKVDIDVRNFNLPEGMKGFITLTKVKDIDKNIDFYRFIKTLIRHEAPSITTLKKWIELFTANQLHTL